VKSIITHLGLYHKLLIGYLLLLAIMILPCAVSIYSLSELEIFANTIAREDVDLSTTIEYLKGLPPSMEAEGRRLLTLYKTDAYDSLLSLVEDFRERLDAIQRGGPRELVPISRNIEQNLDMLTRLADTAVASAPQIQPSEITPLEARREEEVKILISDVMIDLEKLDRGVKKALREKSVLISLLTANAKQITLIVLVGAVAFALVAPWLLFKYIKQPIDLLRRGTETIGKGQFDQTIPVISKDELGQLAAAFNKMAIRLKELDELKSDFIAVASHELKTPLAAMVEAARLLSEPQIGVLNEKQTRLVHVLNESMDRFRRLIDELLQLSRLRARLVPINKRPWNLDRLMAQVIETLSPLIRENDVKIDLELKPGTEQVPVDEERIFRAFMNVVHNAVKFSPRGGRVKIIMENVDEKSGKWVRLGVIDGGPGVIEAERDKIFDKFYQIQAMRRKEGSGLGLAIAREIVLAHGGKIWVESPPQDTAAVAHGKGAAFWVLLPCS